MNKPNIGELIKMKRKELGFSLVEVAGDVGISQPYLSQIENGKRSPSYQIALKIAQKLKINIPLMLWASNLMSDEDYSEELKVHNRLFNPNEEERIQALKEHFQERDYSSRLSKYEKNKYIKLEDFLGNDHKFLFINGHKLSDNEIQSLIQLFEDKPKNYPNEDIIKMEFDKKIKEKEEYLKKDNIDPFKEFEV